MITAGRSTDLELTAGRPEKIRLSPPQGVDGVDVEVEDIDVDALYRTTMRSGLK